MRDGNKKEQLKYKRQDQIKGKDHSLGTERREQRPPHCFCQRQLNNSLDRYLCVAAVESQRVQHHPGASMHQATHTVKCSCSSHPAWGQATGTLRSSSAPLSTHLLGRNTAIQSLLRKLLQLLLYEALGTGRVSLATVFSLEQAIQACSAITRILSSPYLSIGSFLDYLRGYTTFLVPQP